MKIESQNGDKVMELTCLLINSTKSAMSFLKCIPAVIGRFVISVIGLAPCELSERRVNRKVDHVTVM